MKFVFSYLFILSILFVDAQTNKELSVSLIGKLQRAQYDSCQPMFDTSVSNQINSEMLKNIWEGIPKYLGEYKSYTDVSSEKNDSVETVSVRCVFAKTKMDLKLSYNKAQKIIGIFFVPPKNNLAYNYPEYYKSHKFYELKLTLKSGKYELPAVLCIPNNITNPQVAVLIAGSGPNDKDETIGPNKPLKDIAVGLASNGIASIRYDKRTLTYKSEMSKNQDHIGIEEEVIEDALSAVNMIRKNPLTSKSKIYIVGHSLGGMCAPLIARKAKTNGVVFLAANARPLVDLLVEQYTYILGSDSLDEAEKKEIENLKSRVKTVKDPKLLKTAAADQLPLNLPAHYWQSIEKYDQLNTARKLKQPILILQGERDYQVTFPNYEIWKVILAGNSKNKFISYPSLNHLFMKGEGRPGAAEYDIQGNVDEKVITDITEWIKAN